MESMGTCLMILGGIAATFGGIWLLVEASKTSIWWGLGCLLIQFVSLIFVIVHFDVAKKPFFISLAGTAVMVIGLVITPESATV